MCELKSRVVRVREEMEDSGIVALLILNPKNLFYLTGVNTGNALLTQESAILWVKDLYYGIHRELYSDETYAFEVKTYDEGAVKEYLNKSSLREVGIGNLGVNQYNKLKKELKSELIFDNVVEKTRMIKSKDEIELLKKSAAIAQKGMKKAYEVIHEGVTEIDAISEIEHEIRMNGSETPPFEQGMILASGPNAANIHALATEKKIMEGDMVVADLGACYGGYHSDMTRTIPIGTLNKAEQKVFEFVKNLELEAIDEVEVGVKASDIHKFVEDKIKSNGYTFYHPTGHGVGLDIHELPNLSKDSETMLEEGMVFTIEPGIYVPKKFGVRFEDTMLLGKNGCEILTGNE